MTVLAVFDTIWEFLVSGGIFMAFIGAASFVALAVAIHVAISLRKKVVIPNKTEQEIKRSELHFRAEKAAALKGHLDQDLSTLGKIGAIAISDKFSDREEATQAVEANAREEVVKLQGGMGVLEVVITIAPLLGLLGIAIALNTTIAGLVVAILTVIVHSIFTRKIEALAARLEVLAADLVHSFYKNGGPYLYSAGPLIAEEVTEKSDDQFLS